MKGQVYLIQEFKYINTNIFKIGRSGNNKLNRVKSYGKNTRVIRIYECDNNKDLEKKLIKKFKENFTLLPHTRETFKGNEKKIIKIFTDIVNEETVEEIINFELMTSYKDFLDRDIFDEEILVTVEDIIRHKKVTKQDKSKCIGCYKFVRDKYELFGIEPKNGNTSITLGGRLFVYKIYYKGNVKFIKELPGTINDYITITINTEHLLKEYVEPMYVKHKKLMEELLKVMEKRSVGYSYDIYYGFRKGRSDFYTSHRLQIWNSHSSNSNGWICENNLGYNFNKHDNPDI